MHIGYSMCALKCVALTVWLSAFRTNLVKGLGKSRRGAMKTLRWSKKVDKVKLVELKFTKKIPF
jgi:hypothetical protein